MCIRDRYKVVVYEKVDMAKNKIEFNVEGLSAPILSLSQAGIASYVYKLYDYNSKEYELVLFNHEKRKNLYKFKVMKHNIKTVSYTHLDVYKRQHIFSCTNFSAIGMKVAIWEWSPVFKCPVMSFNTCENLSPLFELEPV